MAKFEAAQVKVGVKGGQGGRGGGRRDIGLDNDISQWLCHTHLLLTWPRREQAISVSFRNEIANFHAARSAIIFGSDVCGLFQC